MNKMIDEEFYKYCKKDIDEIMEEVGVFMPLNLQNWQMNKGYYKDDEKTVIFKYLYNDDTYKIGQSIEIFDVKKNSKYTLTYTDVDGFSLSWEEDYFNEEDRIIEKVEIGYDGNNISRFFSVTTNDAVGLSSIAYEADDKNDYKLYLNKPSIKETITSMRKITPKGKTRIRK